MLTGFMLHVALTALTPSGTDEVNEVNELPYRPWQPGSPLPDPRLPVEPEARSLLLGPNYDRRPFATSLAMSALPLECLEPGGACGGHSAELTLAWRVVPHYAWALAFERTTVRNSHVWYGSIGAMVYAWQEGVFDPYLGLDLGLESTGRGGGAQLAGTISFGVHLYLLEHLKLGPLVKLRHSERRWSTCPRATRSCDEAWSATGERWFMLGMALSVPLGAPH